MTKQESINTAYNTLCSSYSSISLSRNAYCSSIDKLVLNYAGGTEYLDIGSATGARLDNLRKSLNLPYVYSIEPSLDMYDKLRSYSNIRPYHLSAQQYVPEFDQKFDCVTALWNVFGHIPSESLLHQSLTNIRKYMKPHSVLLFDVNNRHNYSSYGVKALFRSTLDYFDFRRERGDTTIFLSQNNQKIPLYGHLFAISEVKTMLSQSGFSIKNIHYVNYNTGRVCSSRFLGQIFVCASPC
tara:strand:- start:14108 stop:14827 length:720 start_codon:yes stop_codon:yes gene_type:complete